MIFEAVCLLIFLAIRVGTHLGLGTYQISRSLQWALIQIGHLIWDWALINFLGHQGGHLSKLGTYLGLGTY